MSESQHHGPGTTAGTNSGGSARSASSSEGNAIPASVVQPPSRYIGPNSTILVTDIEASTALAQTLDNDWTRQVAAHHELAHQCLNRTGGFEASNQGDGFLYLFDSVASAVAGAIELRNRIDRSPDIDDRLQSRIGIHHGDVRFLPELGLIGLDIHRCSRVAGAGRGGQILLSGAAADQLPLSDHGYQLIEHGRFVLKDLRVPERLVEVTDRPRTHGAPRARPVGGELPATHGNLIGRADHMNRLLTFAHRGGGGSLLTLSGTGGVGKTRLAVELLNNLSDRLFHLVDLSHIEDTDQVLPEIAAAIGLDAARQADPAAIADELEAGRWVIVLDNLEQLVDVASHIGQIARLAPAASVITTSRRPLQLANENLVEVLPLSTARSESGDMSVAAELFLEFAAIESPDPDDLEAIEQICQSVDGLPLAIELAAGRLSVFPLIELRNELERSLTLLAGGRRDLPPRHQALDQTVRWSYDLLTPNAQEIARWLSQLPAGATTDSMSDLVGLSNDETVTAIAALAEHRLANVEASSQQRARVRMLRVVREAIAMSTLDTSELQTVRAGCASSLTTLVRHRSRSLQGPQQMLSYQVLDDELENLTTLFQWATTDQTLLPEAVATANGLLMFWWQGHLQEGLDWMQRLLDVPETKHLPQYAESLVRLAVLSTYGGAAGRAVELAREAVDVCRQSNNHGLLDNWTIATGLQIQAATHSSWGERDLALSTVHEALEIDRAMPDVLRPMQLVSDGNILLAEHETELASELFTESFNLFEARGDTWLCGTPLSRLAECSLRTGDLDKAEERATSALRHWDASPGLNGKVRAQSTLARVYWTMDRIDEAETLTAAALELTEEVINHGDLPWALIVLASVHASRGQHQEAGLLLGLSRELAESYAQPIKGALDNELRPAVVSVQQALGDQFDDVLTQGRAIDVGKFRQAILQ